MKKHKHQTYTYTLFDVMAASPTEPTPERKRIHQLTRMWAGLASIEKDEAPSTDDWRVCSDAVNLMETLITEGIAKDENNLLQDAVNALALAAHRYYKNGTIRLDAKGIQAIRAILEDYAALLEVLPHRVMMQTHRQTERRILEITLGKRKPHDVEIIAV